MNISSFSIPAYNVLRKRKDSATATKLQRLKKKREALKSTSVDHSCSTCLFYFVGLVVLMLLALAIFLRVLYGGGIAFPRILPSNTLPKLPANALNIVSSLPSAPGNVAVSSDGRVFFTLHPEGSPDLKLVELVSSSLVVPFPSKKFQQPSSRRSQMYAKDASLTCLTIL